MAWFRQWRVLAIAYSFATVVAIREVVVSRSREPVAWPSEEWSRMVEVVGVINPEEPDTRWLESMESRIDGGVDDFTLHLEESLASDIKHNEFLLQDYAQLMLDRGADYRIVNWAANRWRENHPFTSSTLRMELSTGITSDEERVFLLDELAAIPWLDNAGVVSDGEGGRQHILLDFHPAIEIDIRDAVEVATMLTLSLEQRASFRVRCRTLEDCTLVRR
ncbi:MAG: hypothetical protein CL901_04775 [Dehalococcoidia bacterium]|nr:hypothetical protein [Dehalococcoidia bacterium]|tara:strand:- start:3888 stop:4547 length:660 start_codon:yes stop_codon:yes gene_type:complete